MDPLSAVAGPVGILDVLLRSLRKIRELRRQYSGALESLGRIARQTAATEVAVQEICSILRRSPDTFPVSFAPHLVDLAASITQVVSQIQAYVESVREKAQESSRKAKLLHLRHARKIKELEGLLGSDKEVLNFFLSVAQLHQSSGRTGTLPPQNVSDFKRAPSSLSARIFSGFSESHSQSSQLSSKRMKSFPFDAILLTTKPYRRAFASLVKTATKADEEDFGTSSVSSSSVSSSQSLKIAEKTGYDENRMESETTPLLSQTKPPQSPPTARHRTSEILHSAEGISELPPVLQLSVGTPTKYPYTHGAALRIHADSHSVYM
ncbi:hypothetical protein QBC44DRAFT_394458 [Cladorrhinum sp. PSN332]|nr:hypothetical protein QBC44DRAFT_394458 [Cladorrhinum sp. PSN332]